MIKVGSISGACMVGGRNGVGVGAGEQAKADRMTIIRITATIGRLRPRGKYPEQARRIIIIKKGRPSGSPQQGTYLYFFFQGSNTATVGFNSHIKWQSDFAAKGFLSNDCFDLAHQVQVLTQEILCVLTSLTETDITVREEGTAFLNDFELSGKVEYVT